MFMVPGPIPVPPALPGASPGRRAGDEIRPWRVLHASERARDALSVIEIQSAAGMRPWLVTAARDQHSPSLIGMWQHVRFWRGIIAETESSWNGDVVHAHSFASGMAAVRNCSAVVYEVSTFIEESPAADRQDEPHSWLLRSFHVAEQFVFARAGTVVVHTPEMRERVLRRGVDPDGVFVIEPLLAAMQAAHTYDRIYRHAYERRKRDQRRILPPALMPIAACL